MFNLGLDLAKNIGDCVVLAAYMFDRLGELGGGTYSEYVELVGQDCCESKGTRGAYDLFGLGKIDEQNVSIFPGHRLHLATVC